jgi:hypothetical protein
MAQTMYAHMNMNREKKEKTKKGGVDEHCSTGG